MNNNTIDFLNLQGLSYSDFSENEKIISVSASTFPSPQVCPACGKTTSRIHGYRKQAIKDLPLRRKTLLIVLKKRRYICSCGKTFFEKYPFLPKYHRATSRFYAAILTELYSSDSLKSIAKRFSCSTNTVQRMLDIASPDVGRALPAAIGIDEFKGNTDKEKYQCIITDLATGKVFDILPKRNKSYLIDYFKRFSNRKEVKVFAMDMTNNYRSLSFLFPNALVVADRFHYTRQVYWALDNVRKRIQKEFGTRKRKYFKHSRKLLFKAYDELNEENRQAVRVMLNQSNELYKAWRLKENLKYFRKATTREEAEKELYIWILEAEESGLAEFTPATTAFHHWWKEIINSVTCEYSNGRTEGYNNKIKVIKRNAYGFHSFKNFRKRILMNCMKSGNQAVA